jgi:hypothetical protein
VQQLGDAIRETERSRIEQPSLRAERHQPTCGVPLRKDHGVIERGTVAEHAAVALDAGARGNQRVDGLDVVAARRPVQRRLSVLAGVPRVHVSTCGRQHRDGSTHVREVPRPVRSGVQCGTRLPGIAESRACERGRDCQRVANGREVARVQGMDERFDHRVVDGQVHGASVAPPWWWWSDAGRRR